MKKIFILIIPLLILLMTIRGAVGNPDKSALDNTSWEHSPFELSPERGRFALTFSLVEDRSFQFDLPVARFATPDLGYINGKYVSLFAPGVSFLTIPGYVIGKIFGVSQVGTYAVVALFASFNFFLIYLIATYFGAKRKYSLLASVAFLCATPAFAYAVSLYQHHISVFLLLSAIYIYIKFKGILSTFVLWFLIAVSILVDFPNFLMMLPIAIAAFFRSINIGDNQDTFTIKLKPAYLFVISGIVIPALFLLWVNYESYGNPLQLAGTISRAKSIDQKGLPFRDLQLDEDNLIGFRSEDPPDEKSALGFFKSRNISNGLYVHLFSPDRGILFFAPFIIFSIVGVIQTYKKRSDILMLLSGIGLVNLFIYSMWGDPWGGWAFGSRYLIPLYAISSIFLALGLEKIVAKKFLKAIFLIVLIYSVFVNSLGAITTSTNPPKIEISGLEEMSGKKEKYTFERNWDYLKEFGSKSFIYNTFLKDLITPVNFYFLVSLSISLLLTGIVFQDLFNIKLFTKFNKNITMKNSFKEIVLSGKNSEFPLPDYLAIISDFISRLLKKKIFLWKNK